MGMIYQPGFLIESAEEGARIDALRARIAAGEFEARLPYPDRRDDSAEAAAQRIAYSNAQFAAEQAFRTAVYATFGLTEGDAASSELYLDAWERGHAHGYAEVVNEILS